MPENHQQEATQAVQTLADAATHMETTGTGQPAPVRVEMNANSDAHTVATLAEATVNQDGQIILTGDPTTLGGKWIVVCVLSVLFFNILWTVGLQLCRSLLIFVSIQNN